MPTDTTNNTGLPVSGHVRVLSVARSYASNMSDSLFIHQNIKSCILFMKQVTLLRWDKRQLRDMSNRLIVQHSRWTVPEVSRLFYRVISLYSMSKIDTVSIDIQSALVLCKSSRLVGRKLIDYSGISTGYKLADLGRQSLVFNQRLYSALHRGYYSDLRYQCNCVIAELY